jgi:hypothetical protein
MRRFIVTALNRGGTAIRAGKAFTAFALLILATVVLYIVCQRYKASTGGGSEASVGLGAEETWHTRGALQNLRG